MKFDDEICKGVSCPECSFNKGEDGCLLAKRLDEIEIIPESCEDAVPSAQPTDADIQRMQDIEQAMLEKAYECGKQDAAQWIPCSERLPVAKHKTYWICTDTGCQCECRWTNVNHFWTGLTTEWHWHIMDIPQYSKVVAWRELPEPYREVDE